MKLSNWHTKYRIARDRYAGYEVQIWNIWWPFWYCEGTWKTFSTIEAAEVYATFLAKPAIKEL